MITAGQSAGPQGHLRVRGGPASDVEGGETGLLTPEEKRRVWSLRLKRLSSVEPPSRLQTVLLALSPAAILAVASHLI